MQWQIRFITRGAGGTREQQDKLVVGDELTIGRATDQTLQVRDRRVRLEHARIENRDGEFHLVSTTLAGVTVNGRSQRDVRLATGDVIEVGANVLHVLEPDGAADFALSFELRDDARSDHLAPAWTAPVDGLGGFGKRQLSWIAVGLVVLLALVLPSLSVVSPTLATATRALPGVPDDGLWLAGPVHEKHAAVSTDCNACHVTPFQRVPDAACTECHDVDRHVAATGPVVLGEMRCASCHLEHNEPPSLVHEHQGLCADCHRDGPEGTMLPGAADFLDEHPPFRVSLLMPPLATMGQADWTPVRMLLANAATAERSNLKFDHQLHLAADGINSPDGQVQLECADCHVTDSAGRRMLPIRMDEHCSDCHTLNFDPDSPERTVPHGDPGEVLQVLTEYYSARLLGDDAPQAQQRLRRPGQALSREDRDRAAAEARAQALAVAADLFERRACVNCHEVTRHDDDKVLPWRVQPVLLTDAFFPHARFSHDAHSTGVTTCESCHAAGESDSARDLLMPDMDSCRDCHGSGIARRNSAAQTESTCILCHGFHTPAKGAYP